MFTPVIAFAIALLASITMTLPVRKLALRWGMVDRPGPRKVHRTPVPLLGGLAIYCGAVLAILVSSRNPAHSQMIAILAGATLLAIVGILDDRGLLHHQVKLFVGMPVAGLILLASGIQAQVISAYLSNPWAHFLDRCLTVLWVVGITAAFSILDHMDGLCAGVAVIAAGVFTVFATLSGQALVSTLAAAVLGAALGFLRWNFNPAKIFMGDGGAMFLGFMLATLGLKLRPAELAQTAAWMIPVLILGVPIFDTLLVSISRARRGLVPFASPGKDHTAHRLANLGLGQRGAVLVLYGAGGLFGLLALLASRLSPWQSYALAGLVVLAVLPVVILLERIPFDQQGELPEPK